MAELEIIGSSISNYVRSCRMLCFEKSVPHKQISARPRSPEATGIHPYGLIPVMRHGEIALFESKAIMSYIDRVFPGPALMPADPVQMALTEQWIAFQNHKIDRHMMRDYVVQYAFADPAKGPNRARIDGALAHIERQAIYLDEALAKTGFLVGDRLTMADINLLPIVAYVRMHPEGRAIIEAGPNLNAYIDRLTARPSYLAATAKRS